MPGPQRHTNTTTLPRRPTAVGLPRSITTLALIFIALTAAPAITACSPTLLSPNDKRTPFDSYDHARDRFAPQYVENEFGGRVPNLRARLSPNR